MNRVKYGKSEKLKLTSNKYLVVVAAVFVVILIISILLQNSWYKFARFLDANVGQ